MKPTKIMILSKGSKVNNIRKMWLENDNGERTTNVPQLFDEHTENPWLVFQEGNLYFVLYFWQKEFWKLVVRNEYGIVISTLYPNPQFNKFDKCAILFEEEKKWC